MRYRFTTDDPSAQWAGADVPVVSLRAIPMTALDEVLTHLGWRLRDWGDLLTRTMRAHDEDRAKEAGRPYVGKPSGFSVSDEILVEQLTVFASLRSAGYQVSWLQAQSLTLEDWIVLEDEPARKLPAGEETETKDPLEASTGSAPPVDAAPVTAPPPRASGPV